MTTQTETRLPWGQDTITITGRNTGTQHLTVHFDGETLNIMDFLNHSLIAEYAALYEQIMSRCEAKLKPGTLFDHDFPEPTFTIKKLGNCNTSPTTPPDDKTLIPALLNEYNTCLDHIKAHFKDYEVEVEKWFTALHFADKNPS